MKNQKKSIVGLVVLVICIGVIIFCTMKIIPALEHKKDADANLTSTQQNQSDIIEKNNVKYRYDANNYNVLFMGIDSSGEQKLQDAPGVAGQADSIIVMSLNKKTEDVKLLQISRDTMTDVEMFDVNGEHLTNIKSQLATQYAYAMGGKSSCLATKKQVQSILGDLPIDGYLSLNLDGIDKAIDLMGGLTLTLTDDFTEIDPAYLSGTLVTLNGAEAERFVRYRDITQMGSNEKRMKRQVLFLSGLFERLRETMAGNEAFVKTAFRALEPFITTDLTAEQIERMAKGNLDANETQFAPGEIKAGEKYEEFYLDEDKLEDMVLEMFYLKV